MHRDKYKPGVRHVIKEGIPSYLKKITSTKSKTTVKELVDNNR